jgi:hypothetical protein
MTPSSETKSISGTDVASISSLSLDEIPLANPSRRSEELKSQRTIEVASRKSGEHESREFGQPESRGSSRLSLPEANDPNHSGAGLELESRHVSHLPPVDVGRGAWGFVLGALLVEGLTWGER